MMCLEGGTLDRRSVHETSMKIAKLALEDGTVFTGRAFGADVETDGEVVFNTSMTGYQEILTDPSYHGQIVAMTYPQIGNYGINADDAESGKPWIRGFVVRELSRITSNHRAMCSVDDYLKAHGIPGIEGIDTRSLVRLTRVQGALKGILSSVELDDKRLIERAKASAGLVGRDLTQEVMPLTSSAWTPGLHAEYRYDPAPMERVSEAAVPHVVALDFGMKWNIPRHLVDQGLRVTVLPGRASAQEIMEHDPDGIFISNGPGDPEPLVAATSTLQTLIKIAAESRGIPIFGICLGHQLLGQALGARTFKLKFGHRGANHPVRDERSGKVEITTQNHGFAVDASTLPPEVEASHVNLNDGTLEGIRHRRIPLMSVQYHPEASAGPHDSQYLFTEFREMIARKPGS